MGFLIGRGAVHDEQPLAHSFSISRTLSPYVEHSSSFPRQLSASLAKGLAVVKSLLAKNFFFYSNWKPTALRAIISICLRFFTSFTSQISETFGLSWLLEYGIIHPSLSSITHLSMSSEQKKN